MGIILIEFVLAALCIRLAYDVARAATVYARINWTRLVGGDGVNALCVPAALVARDTVSTDARRPSMKPSHAWLH